MKKIALFVLAALLLCSCAFAEGVGLANPMTPVETLEELNELVGCNLVHPAVPGVTDESFFTIDCGDYLLAEYNYAVNGRPYTLRSAAVTQDISGIYWEEGAAFKPDENGDGAVEYEDISTDTFMAARWFTIDGQYCLSTFDVAELDYETFQGIAQEMRELTDPAMSEEALTAYYASIAGEYQDSYSERATMTVTANGAEGAVAEVTWANDAENTQTWTMTLVLMEDGFLTYEDGTHALNGETDTFGLCGWFSPTKDGVLSWSGAPDENCAACVFEIVA